MAISWPFDLPQEVLRDNYQETFTTTSIRTSMDAGPAKVRQRLVANTKPFQVNFYLTSDQVDSLETFYNTTTKSGSLPFTMNDPRSGIPATFRFVSQPQPQANGANFDVQFQIEKMP